MFCWKNRYFLGDNLTFVLFSPGSFSSLWQLPLEWNRAWPNTEKGNTRFYLISIFQRLQKGYQKTVTWSAVSEFINSSRVNQLFDNNPCRLYPEQCDHSAEHWEMTQSSGQLPEQSFRARAGFSLSADMEHPDSRVQRRWWMSGNLLPEKRNGGKHFLGNLKKQESTCWRRLVQSALHYEEAPFRNIYSEAPYCRLALFLSDKNWNLHHLQGSHFVRSGNSLGLIWLYLGPELSFSFMMESLGCDVPLAFSTAPFHFLLVHYAPATWAFFLLFEQTKLDSTSGPWYLLCCFLFLEYLLGPRSAEGGCFLAFWPLFTHHLHISPTLN